LNRGALNTIRFDNAAALDVDADRSSGVLGTRLTGTTLYVSLEPTADAPLLVLRDRAAGLPAKPLLVDSRWDISGMRTERGTMTFHAAGFGPGDMTFRMPATAPGERWEAQLSGKTFMSGPAASDGAVRIRLPAGAEAGVDITLRKSELRPALL
jgi:hypothetical protein